MQETQETQVSTLGQEDPLEEDMATHLSILIWKIPWTEEPGRLQSRGSQGVRHDWAHTHISYGEGLWEFCLPQKLAKWLAHNKLLKTNKYIKSYPLKLKVICQRILLSSCKAGVSNLWDLMPYDLSGASNNNRNKVHNKCNALESSWNHALNLVRGKIVFHENAPWCQKGCGLQM